MLISAGATRMELLKLRRRLVIARRGHKLLKDKQELVMRKILEMITTIKGQRRKIAEQLHQINHQLMYAKALYGETNFESAILSSNRSINVRIGTGNIANILVPMIEQVDFNGSIRNYDWTKTSGELDNALLTMSDLTLSLLTLAINEKTLELLAEELEKTRRRVNALEFVLIPSITETIKYITMKLGETERASLVRLMRIKEILRG
ncbi:MAG: V-type ATP synthase subunit D [candidate division WOR-3 bacterium]|nr:V-type ATP synthase subunit D [candidate division WOR-3 bacterium]